MRGYLNRLRSVLNHPGNRGHRGAAIGRAFYGVVRGLIASRPLVRKVFGDRRLKVYPGSAYWRALMYYGEFAEYTTASFLYAFLRPGDFFVDIGANIGYMSVLASSRIGASGQLLAVEPIPKNFERLRENLALNGLGSARAEALALGTEPGILWMQPEDTTSHIVTNDNGLGLTVPVTTLDELVNEKAAVCKIDVEGFELNVLSGARQAIAANLLPIFVLEINGASRKYGIDDTAVIEHLTGLGYRFGVYQPESRTIDWNARLWDDVIAANPDGQRMLVERLRLS